VELVGRVIRQHFSSCCRFRRKMIKVCNLLLKFNPVNAELNPICHLLALLGGATIVVVSRLRVNINFVPYT